MTRMTAFLKLQERYIWTSESGVIHVAIHNLL